MNYDLFHTNCPNTRGIEKPPGADCFFGRYILSSNDDDHNVMSQVWFECDGCGARLHIDIWPQAPVDPAAWRSFIGRRNPPPVKP